MREKEFDLDKAFEEIDAIIGKLESEETPLKDSIEQYAKGAKLLARCQEELSGIEKEMIVIREGMKQEEEA